MIKIQPLEATVATPPTKFEDYFYGDWRKGQEIQKIDITKRLYQISPNSTQA